MPGSLLEPLRSRRPNQGLVNRANSAHSDRSDASAHSSEGGSSKKVSFNKAVRVKKYSNPPHRNTIDLEDSKFWFKIHKINNHQHHLTPESKLEELQKFTYVQSDPNNNVLDKDQKDQNEEDTSDIFNRLSTIAESDSSFKSTPSMPRKEPIVINYNSEDPKPSETKRRFINYTPYRSKSLEINGEETLRNRSPSPLRSFEYETKAQKVPKDPTWEYHESQRHYEHQKQRTPSPSKHEDSKQQEKKESQEDNEVVQVIEKKSPFLSGFKIMFGATAKAAPIFPLTKNKPEKKEIDYSVDESKNSKSGSRSPLKFFTLDQNQNYQEDIKYDETNDKRTSEKSKYRSRRDHSPLDRQVTVKENVPKTFDNDSFLKSRLSPKKPWDSGAQKASNSYSNKQRDTSMTRREDRSPMNRDEGSQIWNNNSRQKYEDIIKVPKNTSSKEKQMNEKNKFKTRSPSPQKETAKTYEYSRQKEKDKLYLPSKSEVQEEVFVKKQASLLGNESDFFPYLDSYLPKMEDKACQCNLKKSSKHSSPEHASNFRVIKSGKDGSVSTFSDVPLLLSDDPMQEKTPVVRSDVIYSQIDKTKKRNINNDTNYDYQDENNNIKEMGDYLYAKNPTKERLSQSPVRLERTPSPFKQLEKQAVQFQQQQRSLSKGRKTITTVTKGRTFNFEPGVEAPVVKMPLKPPSSKWYPKSSRPSGDNWYRETTQKIEQIFPRSKREPSKGEPKRETIEETMSISNVSSDEMVPHINTDNEDNVEQKSIIRETDHQKNEIFYENAAPRKASPKGTYDGEVTNGSGLWFKSLDEDYRKGMSEKEVSFLPVNYPSSTLSKAEIGRRHSKRDYSPVGPRHAYTLDRRHLEDRKKCKRLLPSQSQMPSLKNVEMYDTRSDRFGHSNMRRFSSNRDLASEIYEPKRGGLAAAYKARQKRASSMDRYGGGNLERYHSALMLNGYDGESIHRPTISRHPSSEIEIPVHHTRSTQKIHENEPVVLYIPAISHHERKADQDDRSSGINLARTQSMLSSTKRTSKKDKKELKEITSKLNGYVKPKSPSGLEEEDEIVELRDEDKSSKKDKDAKKKLIKRSQSMPKDTKLPWLSRFRFKVKPKESH